MKMKPTIAVLTSTMAVLILKASQNPPPCYYVQENAGECGRWTIISNPGWCFYGQCNEKSRCKRKTYPTGRLLDCYETNVACKATLQVFGPPNCTVPQSPIEVECLPSRTVQVWVYVNCPD